MLWALHCLDRPNSVEARDELRKIHREYLDSKGKQIFLSGPLLSDDGTLQIGSLFVLNVPERSTAQAFIDDEPFNRAGVFEQVRIYRMRKGRFNSHLVDE